jgi:hypothetical protein
MLFVITRYIMHRKLPDILCTKNRGSKDSAGGSAASGECVEGLEYGRDSVRGQRDSRKLVPGAPTACQVIVSSNCLRI